MTEIPDSLRSLFSGTVEDRNGSYVIDVPPDAVTHDAVTPGDTYRIAIFTQDTSSPPPARRAIQRRDDGTGPSQSGRGPPVENGEIRTVSVEALGDRGDGIAKVEHGYVVIVPEAQPGDEVTVEIDEVRENVAFATIVGT